MGDFNMPPGVRACDIPGNRPGDDDEPERSCPCCGDPVEEDDDTCPHCRYELN